MIPVAAIIGVMLVSNSLSRGTPVAQGGKPIATVVTAADAIAPEILAAQDLAKTLSSITGTTVPYVASPRKVPEGAIVVGQGRFARNLFPEQNWKTLGEEQTFVRSKGNVLLVAGGRTRGTLYAVDRLLYKLGVRWWTPWATTIPHIPDLTIPTQDESESPAFEYRDPYWFHSFDADWAVHNYDNGANTRVDDAHGGKIRYAGFVHTYYALVPPKKLFSKHPEWFSLINGKRTADDAQLCTTNQALRDYVVQQVRVELKRDPTVRIVSVSQNDCFNPCQCPVCRALVEKEGSESALVLDLANYVAEKIEREFPKVAVDTLAYQWSRHAPKAMTPRSNVIVRLCSIECNFAFPLSGPPNDAFAKDVLDWSRLTQRLYIWDYCTNFANFCSPQPDYFTFGDTLKFLHDHGAKGIFEEGAYMCTGADMAELKAWVLGQLLWDPNQDEGKLVEEFVAGYYGKAAAPILDYLKLMQERAKSVHLGFSIGVNSAFLDFKTLMAAEKLWQQAEGMAADDPAMLWRVKQGHLSVQYVLLRRWDELMAEAKKQNEPWPVTSDRKEYALNWEVNATVGGPAGWTPMTVVDEGRTSVEAFIGQVSGG